MLGYELDEIKKIGFDDIHPKDALPHVLEQIGKQAAGKITVAKDLPVKRKNGSIFYADIAASPLQIGGKPFLLGIFRDITERKKAEEKLKKSEERFRALAETTSDMIWEVDKNGVYTYINQRIKSSMGYDPSEMIGKKTPFDVMTPEDKVRVGEIFRAIAESQKPFANLENWNFHKDGRKVLLETSGVPIFDSQGQYAGYRGIDRDITVRKQAEETLKESEQKFKTIFDKASDGMFLVDLETRKFLMCNAMCLQTLGYAQEEFLNLEISDIHPKDDLPLVFEQIAKFMKGEEGVRHDLRFRRKDGSFFFSDLSPSLVTLAGKKFILIVYKDISERKKAEEMLQRQAHDLGERVKELKCLHELSDLFQKQGDSPEKMLQRTLDLIPPSWQYPEVACARITFEGREFRTENFRETAWGQTSNIIVKGERIGTVEVFYLQEKPEADEGPFLKEERNLLNIIAERLGRNTERKQAEEALRETRDYLQNLIVYANAPIIVWDPQFRITQFNRTFESLTGRKASDIIGKSLELLFPPAMVENTMKSICKTLTGERWEVIEISIQHIDGSVRTVLWNSATIFAPDGKTAVAIIAQGQDITERKKAEEEKRQANEKLTVLVKKLEDRNYQNIIMGEMREMLQACSTMEEAAPIIRGLMEKLFPNSEGALFMMSPSRSDLESVARWGDFPKDVDDNVFAPDACWALRRGRTYIVENVSVGPLCPHLKHPPSTAYVCLPLIAKSDVLGLLHLRDRQFTQIQSEQNVISGLKDMAVILSEYLSLSIANIQLNERLARQSIRDPLTGLFNRRFMIESLEREIKRAERNHTQVGIIMADIDHFKEFNDKYGHAAGDQVLTQMGGFFKAGLRGSDVACRYGGEEFVFFLPECSAENNFKRADQMREEVKNLAVRYGGELLASITLSMGISTYPDQGRNAEDLLRVADAALYRAKQEGRDRVIIG